MAMERKDNDNDTKERSFSEAVRLSSYSNSESTISSYTYIFETIWIQSELEEQNGLVGGDQAREVALIMNFNPSRYEIEIHVGTEAKKAFLAMLWEYDLRYRRFGLEAFEPPLHIRLETPESIVGGLKLLHTWYLQFN